MTLFAEVVFPLPLDRSYSYAVPPGDEARVLPGVRVRAPLGTKTAAGFVVSVSGRPPAGDFVLKEIREVLDPAPVLETEDLAFAARLSAHHRSPLGELLQAMLPPSLEVRASARIRLTGAGEAALRGGAVRGVEKTLAEILGQGPSTPIGLKRKSGLKSVEAAVRRLAAKGMIEAVEKAGPPKRRRAADVPAAPGASQLELDFDAAPAAAAFGSAASAALAAGAFSALYLQGSRDARWSAYVRLIGEASARSRSALVLLPEVSLAEAFRETLGARLSLSAALVRGGTSDSRRERDWSGLRSGEIRVALGTRSALFAPVERPGLIIVDDEADDSHFQAESPSYDARTGARFRAESAGSVLVLGSDAPSVEAYQGASAGGFLFNLSSGAAVPEAVIVDDGRERGLLSRPFLEAAAAALRAGRPGIIFLNRRGYASFLFCPRCGFIPRCPECRSPLSYFKSEGRLSCRSCRTESPAAAACPECGNRVLEPRGAGVEAVEEELRLRFPEARLAVFDSGRVRTRASREAVLARFAAGRIDLLVGTALLAHAPAPRVPFVAVLNPEALLGAADYRAAQRTYQTVRRMLDFAEPVAGGTALVQTGFPDHHSLRAAARGDYRMFFDEEIRLRRAMGLPPFAALAQILFWGGTARTLAVRGREFASRARRFRPAVEIFGPALAAAPAARGGRAVQVVVRSGRSDAIDECLGECLRPIPGRRSVVRSD